MLVGTVPTTQIGAPAGVTLRGMKSNELARSVGAMSAVEHPTDRRPEPTIQLVGDCRCGPSLYTRVRDPVSDLGRTMRLHIFREISRGFLLCVDF